MTCTINVSKVEAVAECVPLLWLSEHVLATTYAVFLPLVNLRDLVQENKEWTYSWKFYSWMAALYGILRISKKLLADYFRSVISVLYKLEMKNKYLRS